MEFQKCTMDAFSVIGKEGASQEGEGFVQKLWQDTNSHFDEIAHPNARKRALRAFGA